MPGSSQFWSDLSANLEDPELRHAYEIESARIATVDRIVNELDSTREAAGMSKAELARAIGTDPAVIRRLFTAGSANPTLGRLAEIAAVLGLEIHVVPTGVDRDAASLGAPSGDPPLLPDQRRAQAPTRIS